MQLGDQFAPVAVIQADIGLTLSPYVSIRSAWAASRKWDLC